MLAAALGTGLLLAFPPGQGSLWPGCLFHAATGLYCPGCGITRCAAALLRGDVATAWAMNPLALVALAVAPLALAARALPSALAARVSRLADARVWATGVIVFFIGRNLPWWPFASWAPG